MECTCKTKSTILETCHRCDKKFNYALNAIDRHITCLIHESSWTWEKHLCPKCDKTYRIVDGQKIRKRVCRCNAKAIRLHCDWCLTNYYRAVCKKYKPYVKYTCDFPTHRGTERSVQLIQTCGKCLERGYPPPLVIDRKND